MKKLATLVPVSIVINGSQFTRDVTIDLVANLNTKGKVGNASYYWNRNKSELPLVFINNKKYKDDEICRKVSLFLLAWNEMMTKKKDRVSFCYEAHEHAEEVVSAVAAINKELNYVSAHPLWLTMAKKKVLCLIKSTGETYERRAIIPKEMKPLVDKYVVNYCSVCAYRAKCNAPCESPESLSKEVMFA